MMKRSVVISVLAGLVLSVLPSVLSAAPCYKCTRAGIGQPCACSTAGIGEQGVWDCNDPCNCFPVFECMPFSPIDVVYVAIAPREVLAEEVRDRAPGSCVGNPELAASGRVIRLQAPAADPAEAKSSFGKVSLRVQ